MPEVRHFCPNIPFVLVGCKKDLRTDPGTIEELAQLGQKPTTYEDGAATAEKIGAFSYIECSAKSKVRRRCDMTLDVCGAPRPQWNLEACPPLLILISRPPPRLSFSLQSNVQAVFETATRAGMMTKKRKGGGCLIL